MGKGVEVVGNPRRRVQLLVLLVLLVVVEVMLVLGVGRRRRQVGRKVVVDDGEGMVFKKLGDGRLGCRSGCRGGSKGCFRRRFIPLCFRKAYFFELSFLLLLACSWFFRVF